MLINFLNHTDKKEGWIRGLQSLIRVQSTGGLGESFPPPKKKVLLKKKLQLFQIKIFSDDDFKESVKVTNVQKCDFSQF